MPASQAAVDLWKIVQTCPKTLGISDYTVVDGIAGGFQQLQRWSVTLTNYRYVHD